MIIPRARARYYSSRVDNNTTMGRSLRSRYAEGSSRKVTQVTSSSGEPSIRFNEFDLIQSENQGRRRISSSSDSAFSARSSSDLKRTIREKRGGSIVGEKKNEMERSRFSERTISFSLTYLLLFTAFIHPLRAARYIYIYIIRIYIFIYIYKYRDIC